MRKKSFLKFSLISSKSNQLIDLIHYNLLINGFAVINDFLGKDTYEFQQLKILYANLIKEKDPSSYEGGSCKVFKNIKNDLSENLQALKIFYLNKTIKKVSEHILGKNVNVDVFQTLDTDKSSHIAQAPHFDRIPTLKFMLYMNDIDTKNGALFCSPGSHHWVKKEFPLPRPKFNNKEFFRKTREIPNFIIDNLIPLNGKEGQLIIFDTDVIHKQGLVENSNCKIFRAHYRNRRRYYTIDQNRLFFINNFMK